MRKLLLGSLTFMSLSAFTTAASAQTLAPEFIPVDSANKMIGSYLGSIDYQNNDSSLQSLVIDATELKRYMDTMSSTNRITKFKIMFAHKLTYINSGHQNHAAAYNRNAFTIVIAGVNENGNYVIFPTSKVFDNSMPCPTSCPSGTASNPLIQ